MECGERGGKYAFLSGADEGCCGKFCNFVGEQLIGK